MKTSVSGLSCLVDDKHCFCFDQRKIFSFVLFRQNSLLSSFTTALLLDEVFLSVGLD